MEHFLGEATLEVLLEELLRIATKWQWNVPSLKSTVRFGLTDRHAGKNADAKLRIRKKRRASKWAVNNKRFSCESHIPPL